MLLPSPSSSSWSRVGPVARFGKRFTSSLPPRLHARLVHSAFITSAENFLYALLLFSISMHLATIFRLGSLIQHPLEPAQLYGLQGSVFMFGLFYHAGPPHPVHGRKRLPGQGLLPHDAMAATDRPCRHHPLHGSAQQPPPSRTWRDSSVNTPHRRPKRPSALTPGSSLPPTCRTCSGPWLVSTLTGWDLPLRTCTPSPWRC